MNIRENLQKTLVPLIPQLSGNPRLKAVRNVLLLDSIWFEKFKIWILDHGALPGPITNENLYSRIVNEPMNLKEGIDFEIMEKNVYDVLYGFFDGGPTIVRPYMINPVTEEGYTLLTPIKFEVNTEGLKFTRTADPNWTVFEFTVQISKKLVTDPKKLKLRVQREYLDKEMKMKDVKEKYGGDCVIFVDLPLQNYQPYFGVRNISTMHPTASSNFPALPSVNGLSDGSSSSFKTSSSLPLSKTFQNWSTSLLLSLFFSMAHQTPIKDAFLSIQTHNEEEAHNEESDNQNGSLLKSFIEYVSEVSLRPDTFVHNAIIFSDLLGKAPELASSKNLNNYNTINIALKALFDDADGKVDQSSLLTTIKYDLKCKKCKKSFEKENRFLCIELELQRKLFKNCKLSKCVQEFFESKKLKNESCKKCKLEGTIKASVKHIHLPNVLIFIIPRDEKGSKNSFEVNYTAKLQMSKITGRSHDEYDLTAVIAKTGSNTLSQKPKLYIRKENSNTWNFFSEKRIIPANESSVILPSNAIVLFYKRSTI